MRRASFTFRTGMAASLAGSMLAGVVVASRDAVANENGRGKAEARLERAGFEVIGEPRRKGDLIIVTATRESISWRIVVDGRSGEIVGQRPIGQAPPLPD